MPCVPGTVKIEPHLGCNLRCDFCGIHGLRDHGPVDIADALVTNTALELREWLGRSPDRRIELAGRGEPTLHADLAGHIAGWRRVLPEYQICCHTNGVRLLKMPDAAGYVASLYRAGMNILILDNYGEAGRFGGVMRDVEAVGVRVYDFWRDTVPFNPWTGNGGHGARMRAAILIEGWRQGKDARRKIHNYAGNVDRARAERHAPLVPLSALPLAKRCARPFRELPIAANGDVAVCCLDWNHELLLGNASQQSVQEIWKSRRAHAVRWLLHSKRRAPLVPCARCDFHGGFRAHFAKPDVAFGEGQAEDALR